MEEAIETCRAALAAGGQIAVVQYRMGLVLAQQNNHAEAGRLYQAALALDPTFSDAQRALDALPK
jgi:tetratricopeptide (TPR) repeat protein